MKSFFKWCRRYVSIMSLIVVAFMAYTMFIQDNSLIRYMHYSNSIDSLRTEIKNYTDTMQLYHDLNSRLSTDPEVMERVVREQYNMKHEDEDVFVFE